MFPESRRRRIIHTTTAETFYKTQADKNHVGSWGSKTREGVCIKKERKGDDDLVTQTKKRMGRLGQEKRKKGWKDGSVQDSYGRGQEGALLLGLERRSKERHPEKVMRENPKRRAGGFNRGERQTGFSRKIGMSQGLIKGKRNKARNWP